MVCAGRREAVPAASAGLRHCGTSEARRSLVTNLCFARGLTSHHGAIPNDGNHKSVSALPSHGSEAAKEAEWSNSTEGGPATGAPVQYFSSAIFSLYNTLVNTFCLSTRFVNTFCLDTSAL